MTLDFLNAFDFFTGVPDSLLAPLCAYLYDRFGISDRHIVAANEGNAAALAAGYYLATGKVPVVYLQNSGEGNLINPLASLLHPAVYGIPCLLLIGWRGEPDIPDEPQHAFQGQITLKLLNDMQISSYIVERDTTPQQIADQLARFRALWAEGRQTAFVVRKGALQYDGALRYASPWPLAREEIIRRVAQAAQNDPIVCTTGKASRELFELRARQGDTHARDFLTVGSMGHASSIALGIALSRPEKRVWCIDGDGAALMHLGALAVIGSRKPKNLIHIVINNQCHDSVGGMPTVADSADLAAVARACGYPHAWRTESADALDQALNSAREAGELCLIEALSAAGARADLGRPTTSPQENKQHFMEHLQAKND